MTAAGCDRVFDAEVQLVGAGLEPAATTGAEVLRLFNLGKAQEVTVELTGRVFAAREDGELDVLEALDDVSLAHGAHDRRRTGCGTVGPMRRELPGGYELDDDPGRIDVAVAHDYISNHSYWGKGRRLDVVADTVRTAARVVGLYSEGEMVGFCRAISDGHTTAYLADVFVLPGHRGEGRGAELVREMVDHGTLANLRWVLHTADAHGLYAKFGFGPPGERTMERGRREPQG